MQDQEAFAIFELRDDGRTAVLDLSSASGASVAQVLADTAPVVGQKTGVEVTVRDINPLQEGTRGTGDLLPSPWRR